jgi:hypothetical protein
MKQFTTTLATAVTQLLAGEKTPSRLTPFIAVQLFNMGCIAMAGQTLATTPKAEKLLKRWNKKRAQFDCDNRVFGAINTLLTESGQVVQHRAIWVAVGRENWERDQVLQSLRNLRDAGVLRSFKKSGNNFQVFWTLAADEPEAAAFETN